MIAPIFLLDTDPCIPNLCQNDGVCLLDDVGGYTCDCHEFTGPNCEIGKST